MGTSRTRTITPAADLDMASATQLGAAVVDSITDGACHLIVDFADVRMIDSAGIGVLLSAQRRIHAAGGDLVVTNPSDHVRRVFALTGVDRELTID
jgi:anti-sigma B factor antagonist